MLKKMPFILLGLIGLTLLTSAYMPLIFKQFSYAISLTIKEVITMVLPLLIFSLIFKTIVDLSDASTTIITIFVLICVSSFITIIIGGQVANCIYMFDLKMSLPKTASELVPLWQISLPKLISGKVAILLGAITGFFVGRKGLKTPKLLINCSDYLIKAIIMLLPLFLFGFIVKMTHEKVFMMIMKDYTLILGITICAELAYLSLYYLLAHKGRVGSMLGHLKSMAAPALTGFSTMSSAAAMPLNMEVARKHCNDPNVGSAVIPLTVNAHMLGDAIFIPVLCFGVLKTFGFAQPDAISYLIFSGYFVMTKFSGAGIPGGSILVMLPVLEANLGFNSEMLTLATTVYILFDPIATSCNVLGNGAFAKLIDTVRQRKK